MKYSKTILIVDDEPRTREGLKKTLETWAGSSYEIVTAENGDDALAFIAERPVHLMLTDIRMPEMNGLSLIHAIKEQGRNPVVILLSGYSEFEYAQEGIKLGVVNYLLKPITKAKLIEAVEQALLVCDSRERAGTIEKIVDHQLMEAKQHDVRMPQPIQAAIQYVEAHVQLPVSLREVADHVHLNASYFSSLFKEKMGMNFSEFLTRSKIQAAKKLLLSTSLPITAIAEEVGYQSTKYFMTLFKEYEGMTPSQYRKDVPKGDIV
ncbi:two component transcriptional regulator, AraC family [Paenibacillus curdlanolyticus YK9]|uniref:Two component transcriptional regulator, AraC family n=1 Tax=Paenibacillus curdlanolyticus YK9 TaxID=717606 RepID=E0I5Z1_9BACL|nr:response regulator [Paenibacillus curdlanolyticus]EFM12383.1 two component transcriptional regulator, AraC family [Paenibacillus curdlanolyticus YK9]